MTSPNGTTHAAITTFDERGVKDGLIAGVAAAAARSAELSGPASERMARHDQPTAPASSSTST